MLYVELEVPLVKQLVNLALHAMLEPVVTGLMVVYCVNEGGGTLEERLVNL